MRLVHFLYFLGLLQVQAGSKPAAAPAEPAAPAAPAAKGTPVKPPPPTDSQPPTTTTPGEAETPIVIMITLTSSTLTTTAAATTTPNSAPSPTPSSNTTTTTKVDKKEETPEKAPNAILLAILAVIGALIFVMVCGYIVYVQRQRKQRARDRDALGDMSHDLLKKPNHQGDHQWTAHMTLQIQNDYNMEMGRYDDSSAHPLQMPMPNYSSDVEQQIHQIYNNTELYNENDTNTELYNEKGNVNENETEQPNHQIYNNTEHQMPIYNNTELSPVATNETPSNEAYGGRGSMYLPDPMPMPKQHPSAVYHYKK